MDMECWCSPLILWGVEVTVGGERKDSCSSMSVTSFLDWVCRTVYLWAQGKLQAEAPSISSRKGSLLDPGYASGKMWHHPCLSHASRLYHCGTSWRKCCQSLCTWPRLGAWPHLSSQGQLSPWDSHGDVTSCHPWSQGVAGRVTPLVAHDKADVDVSYVLQICISLESEKEGSGMACRAGQGAGRLKGILIDECLEICEAKELHLEGPLCRHGPYVPETDTLLTS